MKSVQNLCSLCHIKIRHLELGKRLRTIIPVCALTNAIVVCRFKMFRLKPTDIQKVSCRDNITLRQRKREHLMISISNDNTLVETLDSGYE